MSMSIQERMALQAGLARQSHKVSPQPSGSPQASLSAAQRIAKQSAVTKGDAAAVRSIAPPPSRPAQPTMSVADRIARQSQVAKEQAMANGRSPGNTLDNTALQQLKAEYEAWLKENASMFEGLDPMYFVPKDVPEETKEAVADKVNGVSTTEGEMVITAEPSEQVGGMPYQATPVITPTPRTRRRRSTQKAESTETPTEG